MKILYIAGVAHSGSTYTARIFNQHPSIFSPGELQDLEEQHQKSFDACSCNFNREQRLSDQCDFWQELMNPIKNKIDLGKTARISPSRNREWIRALWQSSVTSVDEKFSKGNKVLFDRLASFTDSEVIVDTSKTPWRLLPLKQVFGDDLFILHLVKSPRNQLASKKKRNYNFYRSAFMKYTRKNLLFKLLYESDPTYHRVQFETFITNLEEYLRELFEWLGLDFRDPFTQSDQAYHHLSGSGSRWASELQSPDPERVNKDDYDWNSVENIILRSLETLFD